MADHNDFVIENGSLTKYEGPGGSMEIPEGVTEIGDRAFQYCKGLTEVMIPATVKRVGKGAFRYCENLGGVALGIGVEEIDDEAFQGCFSLQHIAIPAGVRRIRCGTFAWCIGLKTVALPEGMWQIDADGFSGCKALEGLSLPEGLTRIGENAFYGCERLTELTIPQSVREIGRWAFNECKGLAQAEITDSVVDFSVFWGCTGLETFIVYPASRRYRAVDGVVFSRDGRQLIAYPPGRRRQRYDIPGSVMEFPASAFDRAPVKVVFAPKGVKCIPTYTSGIENCPCFASADPALTARVGRNVYLGPLADLPKRQQRIAAEGFLAALEIGMAELEPWKDGYIDYIRQEYAAFEKKAWRNETLLCLLMERGMLKPETARAMRRKFDAEGKTDLAEALSDYLTAHSDVNGKGMEESIR
jgi:hypothetical protein